MKLILAIRAFRVLCGLFLAATLSYGAETTAFWVFDGENGESIANTVSNRVEGSGAVLTVEVLNPNGNNDRGLPKYSTDILPAPYLFSDSAYTNLIAVASAGGVLQDANEKANSTHRSAYLTITNIYDAIGDGDWTVEIIAKVDVLQTWLDMLSFEGSTNIVSESGSEWSPYYSINTWFMQSMSYTTGLKQKTNPHRSCWPKLIAFDGKTQAQGQWGHYAMRYEKATDKFYTYGNGVKINEKGSLGVELNEKTRMRFFTDPTRLGCFHVYAIRITRGFLPASGFMAYYNTTDLPDTVAHWRFETDGSTNVCSYSLSEGFRTPNNLILTDKKVYTNDVWRPYVRSGEEYMKNISAYSADMTETPSDNNPTVYLSSYTKETAHPKNITIECMFKYFDNSRERQNILGMPDYNGAKIGLGINPDSIAWRVALTYSTLRLQLMTCTNNVEARNMQFTIPNISTNEWHHVAIVCDDDNGDVRFYLDYELRYENTYTLPGETRVRGSLTDAHMTTGTGFNFNFGYCGAIDEIRISRKALAPSEFLRSCNAPGTVMLMR